jgi:hypothetical protein
LADQQDPHKEQTLRTTMKTNGFIFAAGVVAMVVSAAHASTVVWQDGVGNWYGDANWFVDGVPNQTVPDQTTYDDEIIIAGGTVTYNPGGDFGLNWGATTVAVDSGASLVQTTTHWWRFNGDGSFSVNGGSVTTHATNVQFGESGTDTASFFISGGEFIHTGTGQLKVRGGNNFEVAGGLVSSRFYSIGDYGLTSIDLSDDIVRLLDGSVNYNGIYGGPIDFPEGSTGIFNVGNISVSDAISAYLDTGKVHANGATNPGLFNVVEDGSGGVNISLVPEPSASMLPLLCLGFAALRRRQ